MTSKRRLVSELGGPRWPWRPPSGAHLDPPIFIGTTPQGLDMWIQRTELPGWSYWAILKRDAHMTTTAAWGSTAPGFLEPFAHEIAEAIEHDAKTRHGQKDDKQGAPQRRAQQRQQTRSGKHHG